jgi:hypothetical protein
MPPRALLLIFCCTLASFQAPAADAPADLLANQQKEIAIYRDGILKKRELVAKAVADAVKDGRLKPSTAAFYQDALDKFASAEGLLPDLERLYYPPKFDTSEEMEPINFAWAALKDEVQRVTARVAELNSQFTNAIADALQNAARSAEKPEDLDEVDRLLTAWGKLAVPDSISRPTSMRSSREPLQRLAGVMRAVLDGMQKNDPIGVANAFARLSANSMAGMEYRSTSLPISVNTLLDDFRARITAPMTKKVADTQREVEQGIITGRPAEEVEKAIAAFQAGTAMLDRIRNAARNNYTTFPERNQLVDAYRSTLALTETLRLEVADENYASIPAFTADTNYPISAEFRSFLTKLSAKLAAHRRTSTARAEARRQEEERARLAQQEKAMRDAVNEAVKKHRAKLAAVTTPQELLNVADEVVAVPSGDERAWLPQFVHELRSIARWWMDGAVPSGGSNEAAYADAYGRAHPFVAEVRALRSRAVREIASKRLKTTRLGQPPLSELEPAEALQKLSEEAAGAGDWKQVNQILQLLTEWAPAAASADRERLAAVRSYLMAQNLESAGQYQQAALAYLEVIRAVGDLLPTKDAANRLKKLQAEHPETQKVLGTQTGVPAAGAVNLPH